MTLTISFSIIIGFLISNSVEIQCVKIARISLASQAHKSRSQIETRNQQVKPRNQNLSNYLGLDKILSDTFCCSRVKVEGCNPNRLNGRNLVQLQQLKNNNSESDSDQHSANHSESLDQELLDEKFEQLDKDNFLNEIVKNFPLAEATIIVRKESDSEKTDPVTDSLNDHDDIDIQIPQCYIDSEPHLKWALLLGFNSQQYQNSDINHCHNDYNYVAKESDKSKQMKFESIAIQTDDHQDNSEEIEISDSLSTASGSQLDMDHAFSYDSPNIMSHRSSKASESLQVYNSVLNLDQLRFYSLSLNASPQDSPQDIISDDYHYNSPKSPEELGEDILSMESQIERLSLKGIHQQQYINRNIQELQQDSLGMYDHDSNAMDFDFQLSEYYEEPTLLKGLESALEILPKKSNQSESESDYQMFKGKPSEYQYLQDTDSESVTDLTTSIQPSHDSHFFVRIELLEESDHAGINNDQNLIDLRILVTKRNHHNARNLIFDMEVPATVWNPTSMGLQNETSETRGPGVTGHGNTNCINRFYLNYNRVQDWLDVGSSGIRENDSSKYANARPVESLNSEAESLSILTGNADSAPIIDENQNQNHSSENFVNNNESDDRLSDTAAGPSIKGCASFVISE